MASVSNCLLPEEALLQTYKTAGAFTDCYSVEVNGVFTQAGFITAFYTSSLFRLERWILATLASSPSSDQQISALAKGESNTFAIWSVEDRQQNQLLLADINGKTRSWLMSVADPETNCTRLYFGSAVVPITDKATGQQKMGWVFKSLLGFHKLYSKALLYYAAKNIMRVAPY